MRNAPLIAIVVWGAAVAAAFAQSPDFIGPGGGSSTPSASASPQTSGPASSPAKNGAAESSTTGGSKILGKDIPFIDPATGLVQWDGRQWNIQDNPLVRARFEKYLNAAEQSSADELAYRKLIDQMLALLAPKNQPLRHLNDAIDILPQASAYEVDAKLCDTLANTIYNVWRSRGQLNQLERANAQLIRQQETANRNASISANDRSLTDPPPRNEAALAQWTARQQLRRELEVTPYIKRAAELELMIKANNVKREVTEIQTKVDFQLLIVQFFMQRRFQHAVLGSRFYQTIYDDADIRLKVGEDMERLFSNMNGSPPTLTVLESLSQEAMRDVREGVEAFSFLVERGELAGASARLLEAFAIGEHLPEIRSLPRSEKRKVLEFQQKANQLVSALEVRDYTLAGDLTKRLQEIAKDFDAAKPLAVIETARTVSAMHLAKARAAATSGDRATLESELKAATELWPRNPALSEFTQTIFSQADVQQQSLVDLDRLIGQKNFRQIYEDQMRFIAAVALYPERQEKLREVLESMREVETALIRAKELRDRGDAAGAWESVELIADKYPFDAKLSQTRADLTTQAADFVRSLRTAQDFEKKQQLAGSLAWYLNAKAAYPMSQLAAEGVDRTSRQLMENVRRVQSDPEAAAFPMDPSPGPPTPR